MEHKIIINGYIIIPNNTTKSEFIHKYIEFIESNGWELRGEIEDIMCNAYR